jgi:hypothetical protein
VPNSHANSSFVIEEPERGYADLFSKTKVGKLKMNNNESEHEKKNTGTHFRGEHEDTERELNRLRLLYRQVTRFRFTTGACLLSCNHISNERNRIRNQGHLLPLSPIFSFRME